MLISRLACCVERDFHILQRLPLLDKPEFRLSNAMHAMGGRQEIAVPRLPVRLAVDHKAA